MKWHEEIREARLRYKVTQEQIAGFTGLSVDGYRRIEFGKINPSKDTKEKIEIELEKFDPKYKLEALYDYVSISFPTNDFSTVIDQILKIPANYFTPENMSAYGYKETYSFSEIAVRTSETGNTRGTLIEMKGRGCRFFEVILETQKRTWTDFFLTAIAKDGQFTRLDLAIDDPAGILDIPELLEKIKAGNVDTIFKKKTFSGGTNSEDGNSGTTIYLGSKKSDIFFCIYQKDHEEFNKHGTLLEQATIKNRFEIRLRNDRAYNAVMELLHSDMEEIAFGIINHYVSFLGEYDEKQNIYKPYPRWEWFMGNRRKKLNLVTKPKPYTIEKTYQWLSKQVGPSIALTKKLDDFFGTNFLNELANRELPYKQQKQFNELTADTSDIISDK